MNTSRKIHPAIDVPGELEFYDQRHDNLVRIENYPDGVLVRQTRDNLSGQSKEAYVRYLASEGFISGFSHSSCSEVKWVIDSSWVTFRHKSNRAMTMLWKYLTWGRCLSLGLFAVALTLALWFKHH